jgi:glycosyltransferase involved in cell wall biosynthesis
VTAELAAIGVVIPARDEAARLDRCLAAVTASVAALRRTRAGAALGIRVVVVADACTDRTTDVLTRWPGVGTVISDAGRVGAARAAGVHEVFTSLTADGISPHTTWIANTDADSAVPPGWLATHAAAAGRGAALLLGTVRPDSHELDRVVERRWYRRHRLADGHTHVHGANLGVRADWYRVAGGFPPVARDEDVALATAVLAAGGTVERTGESPVLTSARLAGRAPGGMAGYLRRLREVPDDLPDETAEPCSA